MENLLYRLIRYIKYPADTNGKVVEIWQRMRGLTEDFQIKMEKLENNIAALEKKLNNLRNHVQIEFGNVQNEFHNLRSQFYNEPGLQSGAQPRPLSAVFLDRAPMETRFLVLPSPASTTLTPSLDHSRLDSNEDVVVLFADGQLEESEWSVRINPPVNAHRANAYFRLADLLGKYVFSQGLIVAKSVEGVFVAIAVADITSVPVVLIVLDDRTFLQDQEAISLLAEAIDKTRVAFSTSADLCASLRTDFGKNLWFLPAWLQPAEAKTGATIPTNEEILAWILDALKNGFPSNAYLERSGGGASSGLASTVPYADPHPPKSLHWSIHSYFLALHRLAQTGYRPEFIIDVGAATGYWSHVASLIFPKSRFYLIEPLLERYQQRDNDIYSLHPEFITVASAAGDKPGELEFNISPDLYSSSLLDGPPADPPDQHWDRTRVPVRTLDEISSTLSISGRGLLKIDAQLAEHLVLDGAARFLEQIDILCLEVSLGRFVPTSKTLFEMITKLHDLGFEYFDYGGSWRSSITGRMIQQDTVFIRSSLGV
jgi:FkbM family methyltransferase